MILIVDDDERIRNMLKGLLEREGYETATASNGGEALAMLQGNAVDCMLLDMSMPELNGAQLLLLMQAEGIETPVFVVTGFGDFDAEEMSNFANVVGFFNKPMDMASLVDAVRDVVDA